MKKLVSLAATLSLLGLLFTGCASTDGAGSSKDEPVSVHPRDYVFDIIDAGGEKVTLNYNQYGPNYEVKCDFTTLVKKDKPQAGDTVTIRMHALADSFMPVLNGCLVDTSPEVNYWLQLAEYTTLVTDLDEGTPLDIDLCFVLSESPVSSFMFVMQYDNADQEYEKINKPVTLTLERVCESTDTRKEVPQVAHVASRTIDMNKYAAFCDIATNHPWENGQQIMSIIENYRANPEVTNAYGDDLPVAGDTMHIVWKGIPSNDISTLIAYIVDQSEQAAWWKELSAPVTIGENLVAGEPFEVDVEIPIIADAIAKVNVIIQYDVGAATPDGPSFIKAVKD